MTEELQRRMNALILEAAKKELYWGSDDPRHNNGRWKDELRKRLLEELGVDYGMYT